MPGVPGYLWLLSLCFLLCTGGCGCSGHPGVPSALHFGRKNKCTARARRVAGRERMFGIGASEICESESSWALAAVIRPQEKQAIIQYSETSVTEAERCERCAFGPLPDHAMDVPKKGLAALMNYVRGEHPARGRAKPDAIALKREARQRGKPNGSTAPNVGCVFPGWTCVIKRLTVMFAVAAYGAPANAASLSPFAHDGAGRSVLEFYPATVVGFSAQGRDLVSVTVKETPPESDPQGPTDLALIVDCRSRQLAASRISTVATDGTPPTTAAGFKTSDLRPPNEGMYQRFVVTLV
jgi:hypothetical protein